MKLSGMKTFEPQSYASIERTCKVLRKKIAPTVACDEPLPGISLFETLGQFSAPYNGDQLALVPSVAEMAPNVQGETRYDTRTQRISVALSEASYIGLEIDDDGQARFSFFHELTHAFVHTRELVSLAQIPHFHAALMRMGNAHAAYYDSEWQANAGAGALLMPAEGLAELEKTGALTTTRVAKAFKTSYWAASIRMTTYSARREELLAA